MSYDYAATTIVYIKNRTVTKILERSMPYEKWYGEIPSIAFLQIFRNDYYDYSEMITHQKIKEASDRFKKIFFDDRLEQQRKQYRLFDFVTKKCYICRNFIFNKKLNNTEIIKFNKIDNEIDKINAGG